MRCGLLLFLVWKRYIMLALSSQRDTCLLVPWLLGLKKWTTTLGKELFYFVYLCLRVLVCTCACRCPWRLEEFVSSPGTAISGQLWAAQHGRWDPNSGPLQGQQVYLPVELPLQLLLFFQRIWLKIVSTLIVLVCFMWLESKPRASWLLMNTIWLPYSSRLKGWLFILFGLLSSPEQPRLTSVSLPFCLSIQKDGFPGLHQNAHSQMCLSKLSAFLFPWAPSFCHRCLVWQLGGRLQTKI